MLVLLSTGEMVADAGEGLVKVKFVIVKGLRSSFKSVAKRIYITHGGSGDTDR